MNLVLVPRQRVDTMPRVSIHEEDSAEAHLVKVDPGGTFERFLEQAESRLGFRPTSQGVSAPDHGLPDGPPLPAAHPIPSAPRSTA